MSNKTRPQKWDQRPGEPNPSYVAFVLYLSLGPGREEIIGRGAGRQLWQTLMAGIDGLQDDTPLPFVCDIVSALLTSMLQEDLLEKIDRNGDDFRFFESLHKALHGDEQLHSAVESMRSNLEKVKNGKELPPLSYPSRRRIMRDVEGFLQNN